MDFLSRIQISEDHKWREDIMKQIEGTDVKHQPKLQVRKDITDDTVSLESYLYTILSPKFRRPALVSLRITLFAAFPLMVIADKYSYMFPLHTAICLFSIAFSKETIGEQVVTMVVVSQSCVWVMLWGSLMYFFNSLANQTAWWCTLFFITFFLALFGDLPCKRLLIMMTIFVMEIHRAFPSAGGSIISLRMARDMMLSLGFAALQALLPPITMCSCVDETMATAWIHMGQMVRNALKACYSDNPIEVAVALARTSSEPLQAIFTQLPLQLGLLRYEPWESSLRLQLRKERFGAMRNLTPMLHALSGVARALHAGRQKSQSKTEGGRNSTIPAEDLIRGRLDDALQPFLDALDPTLKKLGCVLNPKEVVTEVPFDDLQKATSELQSAIDKIHYDMMGGRVESVDPVWYIHIVFAHLMVVLFGEELLRYAELMRNFDRSRYMSTCQCILNFWFLEHWNNFWEELPKRLTLATPRDVRIVKDAFKLACGYTVASVCTLYVDQENVYYFGMNILMGVGLPTAGDTLVAGIQRVAGLLFAASIAFLLKKHSSSEFEIYAIALLAILVSLFARIFPSYLDCSFYTALLIPSMLQIVLSPMMLLSRVISSALIVMTYYFVVVFVFPIDTIKLLHNAEVSTMNGLSDYFSRLMRLLQVPIGANHADIVSELDALKADSADLWVAIRQVPVKIKTAAVEPTIRGLPYPVHEQDEFAPVLRRLAASLDIIHLGLAMIHRKRMGPVSGELNEILLSSSELANSIAYYSVFVMQDFVDAVQVPTRWSYENSITHLSILLVLNAKLKEAFSKTHSKILEAIRQKANELRCNNLKLSMACEPPGNGTFAGRSVESWNAPYGENDTQVDDEEDAERVELTAPRNVSFMLRPEEFTINHDMNMSIAILVGIDIFCTELVKTVRVMHHLNRFELSRRQRLNCRKKQKD